MFRLSPEQLERNVVLRGFTTNSRQTPESAAIIEIIIENPSPSHCLHATPPLLHPREDLLGMFFDSS